MPARSSSSESESLSQICFPRPFGCLVSSSPVPVGPGMRFAFKGVRTLMPGTLVLRAGVSKISECSSGAGRAGEESNSSSSMIVDCGFDFPLAAPAGVSLVLFRAGVLPVRYGKVVLPGCRVRVVVWGVAWRRQFLSRMRWRRGSSFGSLCVRAVEGV